MRICQNIDSIIKYNFQLKSIRLLIQQFQSMSFRDPSYNQKRKSYSKDFCNHNKPKLEQRFRSRDRVKTSMYNDDRQKQLVPLISSLPCKTQPSQQIVQYSKTAKNNNCKLNDNFNETLQKLNLLAINHHNAQNCLCSQCTCGRHLCKFHPIRPDFTKNSVYKKDYLKKKPIPNKINIHVEYDQLKGPNLDLDTMYTKQFKEKVTQFERQRPKPKDILNNGGPLSNITSYSSGFPGHFGNNQYVKPTDRHFRGNYPLNSRSTYSNTFTTHPMKRVQGCKTPDNLKTGSNWYGASTYSNNFKEPNPEDYALKYKIKEKLEKNPDYKHQYETFYRKQFKDHQPVGKCPAKVILQTRAIGFFSGNKDKFAENSDFKTLDPTYKPITRFG